MQRTGFQRGLTGALVALGLLIASPVRAQFVDATTPELEGPLASAGAAWGDYDGDGDLDVYIANADGANVLLRNDGMDGFVDVTSGDLELLPGMSQSVAWADVDNDGDLDLYVVDEGGGNKLLRNEGGDLFTTIPGAAADPGVGSAFSWADFDRDGLIDLYLGNVMEPNVLFRNVDGTQFDDLTAAPLDDVGTAGGVAWGDYDDDGDQDLYLVNIGEPNRLFRNDSGVFADATTPAILEAGPSVSANWVDYDNDLDLDLYVVSFFAPNKLFRNDGNGVFVDVAAGTPLGDAGSGFVAEWADVDNDGDQDLYLINHLSPNILLRNDGGTFVEATGVEGAPTAVAIDVSWADVEGDGDLDLYLTDGGGPNRLFRNDQATGNGWLQLVLQGTVSNSAAIGARVIISAGGVSQMREVDGGNGYLSQSSLDVEFGLGSAAIVDSVEIRWPSGIVQTLTDVAANQKLVVQESDGVSFVRGDANADGAYDISDAIATLGFLFQGELVPCELALDVNDDEGADISDAIFTLTALFSSGPLPAAPFPDCGGDPTAGGLECSGFPACP